MEVYNRRIEIGTEIFGKYYTTKKSILFIMVSIAVLIVGVLIVISQKDIKTVKGTILSETVDCVRNTTDNSNFDCNFDVKYTIEGKEYINQINTTDYNYSDNIFSDIKLYYYPEKPYNAKPKIHSNCFCLTSNNNVGWLLIAIPVAIIIYSLLNLYTVYNMPVAAFGAGLEGGMTGSAYLNAPLYDKKELIT
jgi:hypothetical protein